METKIRRSRTEVRKNKKRKKPVDFESGAGSDLKRRRKKIEMPSRLMRMNRLNGGEGFHPEKNQSIEISEAGKSQPAIPSEKYSLEVSCFPKMYCSVALTRV